jgi:2-methylcitrate dehydratase PrpD
MTTPGSPPGISLALARFVADARYEDLSPVAARMAKLCLLDAIGVSLAASSLGEGCAAFADLALSPEGAQQCTVFGFGRKAPPEAAALVNGALAHALDFEDSHDGALLHPNAPAVPAALAIAQAWPLASGRELLTALAMGCEISVRLALAVRGSIADYGWYPPPIFAAFGAAAVAAKLLRLSAEQTRDAWSLALCQATCSGEIIYSPGSTVRAIRDAFVARAAVTSALLARNGVRGFDAPFEGRAGFFATYARGAYDPEAVLRGLGGSFEIERISFKPWPSCRGTHAAIEAALACRREAGFDAHAIERVQIRGGRMLRMLCEPGANKRRPATSIDAKFSLPFAAATALLRGRVALEDFSAEALHDPDVLRLAARIHVDPAADDSPSAIGARLDVRLQDGRTLTHTVATPLGAPSNPMPQDAVVAKFLDCARYAATPIDEEAARTFAEVAMRLEDVVDADREWLTVLGPR